MRMREWSFCLESTRAWTSLRRKRRYVGATVTAAGSGEEAGTGCLTTNGGLVRGDWAIAFGQLSQDLLAALDGGGD